MSRGRARSRSPLGAPHVIRIRSPAPRPVVGANAPWEGALWRGWIRDAIVAGVDARGGAAVAAEGPRDWLVRTVDFEAREARNSGASSVDSDASGCGQGGRSGQLGLAVGAAATAGSERGVKGGAAVAASGLAGGFQRHLSGARGAGSDN